jgi:hypothetical protein
MKPQPTALETLEEFSSAQGWDAASEVFLLAAFIDKQGLRAELYNFLFAEAARENELNETGEPINA